MKNRKQNQIELRKEIMRADAELLKFQQLRAGLLGIEFIDAAIARVDDSQFLYEALSYTKALIGELNERDWPLDRAELEEIFINSGFEYTQSDIEACRPDSQAECNDWQRAHSPNY